MSTTRKFTIAVFVCAVTAFGAPPAMAQTASEQGYEETGILGQVQNGGTSPAGGGGQAPTKASPTSSNEGLPFTGLDLGILAAMGVTLAGTGVALRRVTRTRTTS
jgi:hypothetical protein